MPVPLSSAACALRAWTRRAALLAFFLLLPVAAADAQPTTEHMCGDGTTFTVNLPGTNLGIDNSDGLFRSVIVPTVPADSITLPGGCRLYVLLVSGYNQNKEMDRIIFYKVAEFAAQNNGYVHVSWWNNLLKPYLGGPLHPVDVTIERFLLPDIVIEPNPGGYDASQLAGLFAPDNTFSLPKANPSSDTQFVSDAAAMIRAIKANEPDAIIVVAGHSMGGDAAARLGRHATVPIDLLALVDPVNNDDLPRGLVGAQNFNWTRWRSANNFRGFKQWDCVRNALGLCQDFDSRLLFVQYKCTPVGSFLSKAPLVPTRAPIACPALRPYADTGVRHTFGPNVKRLYHRWQHEANVPLADAGSTERFNFWVGRGAPPDQPAIVAANYQEPFLANNGAEGDPNKTCADVLALDPRRGPPYFCGRFDGHSEIVGYRAPQGAGQINPLSALETPGLGLRNWSSFDAELRRQKLLELPTAEEFWPYRPSNPDTCMVCDDIITNIKHLLEYQYPANPTDTLAPVTLASSDPGPNAAGWVAEDVQLTFTAVDEAGGSGVREVAHLLAGGGGPTVTPGSSAQAIVTAEGTTTVSFFARDNAGNSEAARTLEVRIDKTPPEIAAVTDVVHNADGWFRTGVVVSFPAFDTLSGLAFSSPEVEVSAEGAGQEIVGQAEDHAGNQSTATVTLNIDRTPPQIEVLAPAPGAVYLLNGEVAAAYACSDALSGVRGCAGSTPSGAPLDTSAAGERAFTVQAGDLADNLTAATLTYSVRYGFSGFNRTIEPMPALNRVKPGLAVPVKYRLQDAQGRFVRDLGSFVGLGSSQVSCEATEPGATAADPGTITYDLDREEFLFEWYVDPAWAGTCRMLELRLADGTRHLALFTVR